MTNMPLKGSIAELNCCQHQAYDAIITSVQNEEDKLIFIHGHGGTGKTFLYNNFSPPITIKNSSPCCYFMYSSFIITKW